MTHRWLSGYEKSLRWALKHGPWIMLLLLCTIGFNVYLYNIVPKGFFPIQDTGRLSGTIQADQSISSPAMQKNWLILSTPYIKTPTLKQLLALLAGNAA